MRNPNGFGCIKKLSGKRRRPYAYVITVNGKQKALGYFATHAEALMFQLNYTKTHKHLAPLSNRLTFEECYYRWYTFHVTKAESSESTIANYKNAYRHCRPISKMFLDEIKYYHLQTIIDNMRSAGLSYSSAKKVKSLMNMLFKFGIKNEFTTQNFATLVDIGKNKPVYPHKIISRYQINKLWKIADSYFVDSILILLYTGMRVSEMLNVKISDINLKQKTLRVTKSKNDNGIRTIPIHERILPLVLKRCQESEKYLIEKEGQRMNYSTYRREFDKILAKHTPHNTRHTTTTMLDNADANRNSVRKILGHSGGDITDAVYTHKGLRQLRKAIHKIK